VQGFCREITELRALGFAEGLPMDVLDHRRGIVVRLEAGRVGLAVEFCADGAPRYVAKPLVRDDGKGSMLPTDVWNDVVREIGRRAPTGRQRMTATLVMANLRVDPAVPELTPGQSLTGWRRELSVQLLGEKAKLGSTCVQSNHRP
jgi:hypothetical protein